MDMMEYEFRRRTLLKGLAGCMVSPGLLASVEEPRVISRTITSSSIELPVIGLGSWLTFDAGPVQSRRDNARDVMREFFELGGAMIDSSPMYASSQSVIGEGLSQIQQTQNPFFCDQGLDSGPQDRNLANGRGPETLGIGHI